ncbi:hypothetical protein F6455_16120 [Proteobacteria bacterium 005FR1]|nr:hypothetical protein [Proteobacteria bacterium 005FR1]
MQISPHKTVLIVDGDSESSQLASSALSRHFNILTASSVSECLEIAHNCHPDLIIFSAAFEPAEIGKVQSNLQGSDRTAGIPTMRVGEMDTGEMGLLREVDAFLA